MGHSVAHEGDGAELTHLDPHQILVAKVGVSTSELLHSARMGLPGLHLQLEIAARGH